MRKGGGWKTRPGDATERVNSASTNSQIARDTIRRSVARRRKGDDTVAEAKYKPLIHACEY
jgi:hypothetical protein